MELWDEVLEACCIPLISFAMFETSLSSPNSNEGFCWFRYHDRQRSRSRERGVDRDRDRDRGRERERERRPRDRSASAEAEERGARRRRERDEGAEEGEMRETGDGKVRKNRLHATALSFWTTTSSLAGSSSQCVTSRSA